MGSRTRSVANLWKGSPLWECSAQLYGLSEAAINFKRQTRLKRRPVPSNWIQLPVGPSAAYVSVHPCLSWHSFSEAPCSRQQSSKLSQQPPNKLPKLAKPNQTETKRLNNWLSLVQSLVGRSCSTDICI